MKDTFVEIPEEFQIKSPLHQTTYLVNGELRHWNGETAQVYSTISSTKEYKKTLLGTVPQLGEEEAMDALNAATSAYDNGKGLWATMKVAGRIACMETFVEQMKFTK